MLIRNIHVIFTLTLTNKTKMERNQEIMRVNVSENIEAIANCIQENISGRKAGSELIEWCENNQDKLAECGFHNYNCLPGEVKFDSKLEDNFDDLLEIVQPLRLR